MPADQKAYWKTVLAQLVETPEFKEDLVANGQQLTTGVELEPFLARAGLPPAREAAWLVRIVETLRERARTLVEMAEQATFYFKAPEANDPQATAKFWKAHAAERVGLRVRAVARLPVQPGDALPQGRPAVPAKFPPRPADHGAGARPGEPRRVPAHRFWGGDPARRIRD